MLHVRKKKWMGCAVASAAMLADFDYDDVEAHWPDVDEARLRCPKEFRALLESLTESEWRLSEPWLPVKSVLQFAFPEWPTAAFIRDAPFQARFGQWIVVKGKIVHDPRESRACLINHYSFKDWPVTWTLQPARPDELTGRRSLSRLDNALKALEKELGIKPDAWVIK
jgi:hypothetical protein